MGDEYPTDFKKQAHFFTNKLNINNYGVKRKRID